MIEIKNIEPHIKLGILDLKVFSLQNSYYLKRDVEKAGTIFLLTNLLETDNFKIEYTLTNKPFLKGRNEHISISHSYDKLAIILNNNENTGVDVELIRDKILAIKHKFLNENETNFANNNVEQLTYIWAAKETLYKIYGIKGLDFKLHLSVEINENKGICYGNIIKDDFKKRYVLKKEKLENYCLVYALHEL